MENPERLPGRKGNNALYGSKDVTRTAFKLALIDQGEIWMDRLKSRNQTSHTYNEEVAQEIVNNIVQYYFHSFLLLYEKLELLKNEEA